MALKEKQIPTQIALAIWDHGEPHSWNWEREENTQKTTSEDVRNESKTKENK